MADNDTLEPGTLWPSIVTRAEQALACGALKPIATEIHDVEDAGISFQIRVVSSLQRRAARPQRGNKPRPNPFLPYEKALFVTNISATHICLLNKYPVASHHALIVTRAFEPQENQLTLPDFEALSRCMAERDAVVFYNSGPIAGASQPHKHLQLIPLPANRAALPIEPLLNSNDTIGKPTRLEQLPFAHAFSLIEAPVAETAERLFEIYLALLRFIGWTPAPGPLPPYNLLIRRRFMWLIPRARAEHAGININALGFAGVYLVPDLSALETVRRVGPMALLQEVAVDDNENAKNL